MLRRHSIAAGLALALLAQAGLLPPLGSLMVLLHEGSHALAAVLTGGQVLEITVAGPRAGGPGVGEAGHTLTTGGAPALIAAAGYPGALLLSALAGWLPPRRFMPALSVALVALSSADLVVDGLAGATDARILAAHTGLPAAAWSAVQAAALLPALGLLHLRLSDHPIATEPP